MTRMFLTLLLLASLTNHLRHVHCKQRKSGGKMNEIIADSDKEDSNIDTVPVDFPSILKSAAATSQWSDQWAPQEAIAGGIGWISLTTVPQAIWFELKRPIIISTFQFQSRIDLTSFSGRDGASRYKFFGSNNSNCGDSKHWETLYMDENGSSFDEYNRPKMVIVGNTKSFSCYGFAVTETPGGEFVAMSNVRFWHKERKAAAVGVGGDCLYDETVNKECKTLKCLNGKFLDANKTDPNCCYNPNFVDHRVKNGLVVYHGCRTYECVNGKFINMNMADQACTICKDVNERVCKTVIKDGLCTFLSSKIQNMCEKSCNVCTPLCEDMSQQLCPQIAENGLCNFISAHRRRQCKRSCRVCGPLSLVDYEF